MVSDRWKNGNQEWITTNSHWLIKDHAHLGKRLADQSHNLASAFFVWLASAVDRFSSKVKFFKAWQVRKMKGANFIEPSACHDEFPEGRVPFQRRECFIDQVVTGNLQFLQVVQPMKTLSLIHI